MSQTVGLDLQTTYSCVGVFRHGKIEYIGNDQGNRATYNPQSDGMVEKRQQSIFKYFMMSQGPVSELTAVQQDAENLMYTPSHTDTDKPMFPAFAECSKRLESFRNWPEYPSISRKDLAEAGLVYIGVADVTRCYSCGGGHCCWTDNHIPMEEHARLFPKCSHILQVKGTKFVKEICKKKKTEMHVGTVIQQFRVENETPELGYPSRLARKTSEIHKEYDEKYQGYSQRFSGVKEDTKQMSDRHRVSLILQSEAFGRELEATVEEHLQQNNSPERLMALQQITDLLAPNKKPFQGEFETGTQGTKQKPDADNVHLKTPVPSIASRAIIGEETIAAVQKAGSKSKSNDFHPEKPEVPQYAAYAKRLQSFEKWPESPSIDKKRLEEAGFAYTNSCYLHTDLLRLFREENCNSERKKDKSWFNNKQGWAIKMINSLMNVINGTLKTATEVMSLLVQKCPELFPKLDRTPTQKDLLSFAQAIGENFRYFGLALGIGDVSLDQISMENPTVVMKTFKMLRKWCDENPLESSLSKLIQTLKTCSCVRVDWGQIGKLCL